MTCQFNQITQIKARLKGFLYLNCPCLSVIFSFHRSLHIDDKRFIWFFFFFFITYIYLSLGSYQKREEETKTCDWPPCSGWWLSGDQLKLYQLLLVPKTMHGQKIKTKNNTDTCRKNNTRYLSNVQQTLVSASFWSSPFDVIRSRRSTNVTLMGKFPTSFGMLAVMRRWTFR